MVNDNSDNSLQDRDPNSYHEGGGRFGGPCEVCQRPGRIMPCPLPLPYTGCWCEDCAEKMIRLYRSGLKPMEIIPIVYRREAGADCSAPDSADLGSDQ